MALESADYTSHGILLLLLQTAEVLIYASIVLKRLPSQEQKKTHLSKCDLFQTNFKHFHNALCELLRLQYSFLWIRNVAINTLAACLFTFI